MGRSKVMWTAAWVTGTHRPDRGQTRGQDFSLRLAAYEPNNLDYPAAVSNVIYVTVDRPTPTVPPTAPPTATPTTTPTPAPTATPAATATRQASPTPAATATRPAAATQQPNTTPTATPKGQQPTPTAAAGALQVAINTPADGDQISGRVAVMGDAYGPGFAGFQLIFAPGTNPGADAWQAVQAPQMQPSTATGGLLGFWTTDDLTPGTYTLRLMALDNAGATHTAAVTVEVVAAKKQ